MRPLFLFVFVFVITTVEGQRFKIKSAEIAFEFVSKEVQGTIEGFESTSSIDWNDPTNSIIQGSVTVASLDTNNSIRNWMLKGSRYFAEKDHPLLTFTSVSIAPSGNSWLVNGDLTIKGITKSIQIDFKKNGNQLIGKASMYSSDFDITIKKKREDNKVDVTLKFTLLPF